MRLQTVPREKRRGRLAGAFQRRE